MSVHWQNDGRRAELSEPHQWRDDPRPDTAKQGAELGIPVQHGSRPLTAAAARSAQRNGTRHRLVSRRRGHDAQLRSHRPPSGRPASLVSEHCA